jgi:hypothetical protein
MQSMRAQSLLINPTGRFGLISCSVLERAPKPQHAYQRAIGLAEDPAVREFLIQKRAQFFYPICRNPSALPVTTMKRRNDQTLPLER